MVTTLTGHGRIWDFIVRHGAIGGIGIEEEHYLMHRKRVILAVVLNIERRQARAKAENLATATINNPGKEDVGFGQVYYRRGGEKWQSHKIC